MLPGRLGIELLRKRVQLGVGLLERPLLGRREAVPVGGVALRAPCLVDVDVVSVPVRGEELDAELVEQRVHSGLIRRDPLAAELVRLPADLRVPEATADAVARLEKDDVTPGDDELPCRREAGHARPDHDDLGLDQAGVHASLRSAAAAAPLPVRTAPSMYPATHWSEPQT